MNVQEAIKSALAAALEACHETRTLPPGITGPIRLHTPPVGESADYSTDLPSHLARATGLSPSEAAQRLLDHLTLPQGILAGAASARTGLLSFTLSPDRWQELLATVHHLGPDYGREAVVGAPRRALVEYVSAQPTGPLTVTHGRAAVLGEGIARLLAFQGWDVARESYVNDVGVHLERFLQTVEAALDRAAGRAAAAPGDALQSPLAAMVAREAETSLGPALAELADAGVRHSRIARWVSDRLVSRHRALLEQIGVRFDYWVSERELAERGRLQEALGRLRTAGNCYEDGNALWLRARDFGDTQDRTLIRTRGGATYLAGDLAYHLDKGARGYDLILDLWASDHAPYAGRLRAGLLALGFPGQQLEIRIFQPITLKRAGVFLEVGARPGNTPLLEDVMEEIGPDAIRYFFLTAPQAAPLELDLETASQSTESNPLLRLREGWARMTAAAESREAGGSGDASVGPGRAVLRRIAAFPDEAAQAAREREPHRLIRFATNLLQSWESLERTGTPPPAVAAAAAVVLQNLQDLLGLRSERI